MTDLLTQLDAVLDQLDLCAAVLCGVSIGGLVALRYAAERPARVAALVLASAPGPDFALTPLQRAIARHPVALAPLFAAGAPGRLGAEMRAALPSWRARWRVARHQIGRLLSAPPSPSRMAARATLALAARDVADPRRIVCPTLIVTGERHLDRIVPVASSQSYAATIAGARTAFVPQSGHLGIITKPAAWAAVVGPFARDASTPRRGVA